MVGLLRHLDPSGGAARLHPAGGVDSVAPDVVGEPVAADYGGHRRAAVDADTKVDCPTVLLVQALDAVEHVEGHVGDRPGVVRPRHRQSAYDEVRIAGRANGT